MTDADRKLFAQPLALALLGQVRMIATIQQRPCRLGPTTFDPGSFNSCLPAPSAVPRCAVHHPSQPRRAGPVAPQADKGRRDQAAGAGGRVPSRGARRCVGCGCRSGGYTVCSGAWWLGWPRHRVLTHASHRLPVTRSVSHRAAFVAGSSLCYVMGLPVAEEGADVIRGFKEGFAAAACAWRVWRWWPYEIEAGRGWRFARGEAALLTTACPPPLACPSPACRRRPCCRQRGRVGVHGRLRAEQPGAARAAPLALPGGAGREGRQRHRGLARRRRRVCVGRLVGRQSGGGPGAPRTRVRCASRLSAPHSHGLTSG